MDWSNYLDNISPSCLHLNSFALLCGQKMNKEFNDLYVTQENVYNVFYLT